MNPVADSLSEAQFPPLADVRKNLKIRWYRCPIDRTLLRTLSTPNDVQGFIHAFGHLGLWLTTCSLSFYAFSQSLWWLFFPTLFLHGTVSSFLTAPHHELCHKTVFRSKQLNEFFLRLFSLMGWFNFYIYRFSHNYHHRYTLHPTGDREEVMPAVPSLRVLFLIQLFTFNLFGGYQSRGLVPTIKNFYKIATHQFDNPFNSWGSELYEGFDEERRKATTWARHVIIFHATVIVISLVLGYPILILLISGSVFMANWLRYFVGVPMHCGLQSNTNDFRKSVRTITLDPFSEFLYWHMNWHLEHHMYAGIPCYNLKKLHHAVKHDMPRPRTLISAWKEMRETWQRQQSDPLYAFDTPLPDTTLPSTTITRSSSHFDDATCSRYVGRHNDDELAASIGGLSPNDLSDEHKRNTF